MGKLVIKETFFGGNISFSYGGGLISMDRLDVIDSEILVNMAERGGGLRSVSHWMIIIMSAQLILARQ